MQALRSKGRLRLAPDFEVAHITQRGLGSREVKRVRRIGDAPINELRVRRVLAAEAKGVLNKVGLSTLHTHVPRPGPQTLG